MMIKDNLKKIILLFYWLFRQSRIVKNCIKSFLFLFPHINKKIILLIISEKIRKSDIHSLDTINHFNSQIKYLSPYGKQIYDRLTVKKNTKDKGSD